MKKLTLFLVFAALLSLCFSYCKKAEQEPPYYGDWETVTTTGFSWEYEVNADRFCTMLPEHFGSTQFCYQYTVNKGGDTLRVDVQGVEVVYVWEFVGNNTSTAVVEQWQNGERSVYLVQRK